MTKYDSEGLWSDEGRREGEKLRRSAEHAEGTRRGPMDIPFLLLTMIILTVGVVMVLSASFARAYYESADPTRYFVRQLLFAVTAASKQQYNSSPCKPFDGI